MFDDEKRHMSIHLKDVNPEIYVGKTVKQMKKHFSDLYNAFSPKLIKTSLKDYLKQFKAS